MWRSLSLARHPMFRDRILRGHYVSRHFATRLWVALPSRVRWSVVKLMDKFAGYHWCDLVDSCVYADYWGGYRSDYADPFGCLCDFPLPYLVSRGNPDCCYCGTCSCGTELSAPDA